MRFQSSPNLSAGCSHSILVAGMCIPAVSILTQPLGWVQALSGVVTIGDLVTVSILTQPLGWVQPEGLPHFRYHHISFNPHLTSRLGAAQMLSSRSGTGTCFNPHPTSRLGAVDVEDLLVTDVPVFQSAPNLSVGCSRWPDRSGGDVSILTQHLDWVQLGHVLNRPLVVSSFNPHPTYRLGAAGDGALFGWRGERCFNPHPTSRLGAAPGWD